MVRIGHEIPDLELRAFHNGEIKEISLSQYRGQWLVLLFYPADFTFVCPTELEDAAGLYGQFKAAGAEILSVSTDTEYVHAAWHEGSEAIGKVQYPMVADPTGRLSRTFGVYVEEAGLALRGTFIVDPDGQYRTFSSLKQAETALREVDG